MLRSLRFATVRIQYIYYILANKLVALFWPPWRRPAFFRLAAFEDRGGERKKKEDRRKPPLNFPGGGGGRQASRAQVLPDRRRT